MFTVFKSNPVSIPRCHGVIAFVCAALAASCGWAGETLYNGIELPDEWPPTNIPYTRKPMPVPYLETQNIPKVIPIDVGRQLLVDDFLIAETDLARTFHKATPHEANPVLTYDQPWEGEEAFPYAGGMWYDPSDQLFKAWYNAGEGRRGASGVGYATSKDGIHWHKPSLDVAIKGTSCVLHGKQIDSTTIWLDHNAKSPEERFKMMYNLRPGGWHVEYRTSPDGIHWSPVLAQAKTGNDYDLFCYNPFRKKWVYLQRTILGDLRNPIPDSVGRARTYREGDDLRKLIAEAPYRSDDMEKSGPPKGSVFWCGSDELDPRNPDKKWAHLKPQMYTFAPGAYESLMIGMFAIWSGPPNAVLNKGGQKRCDILVGFSRDGFHWDRPSRKLFISSSWKRGTWDYGNVQPVTNCCLVVGDKLYIYHSARKYDKTGRHSNISTGLATLRRDGFASMDADGKGRTLTTRPLTFKGKHLFVNVDCPKGELSAEVLDKDGKVVAPFTLKNCKAVSCDKTLAAVTWRGVDDLSTLAGRSVRFRFHLQEGSLYAFWVSPDRSGASHGYVAAGGPGFTGPTDTVGMTKD